MNQIQIAILELGKEEIPRNSNWGEHVQKYLASVGINFPASWCMAFSYWCCSTANPNTALIRTGGVLNQWNKVSADRKFSVPEPGDVFIIDEGHGLGHAGLVESVDGLNVHTIEGNTNEGGSREGYGVFRRTRAISSMKGFIRP